MAFAADSFLPAGVGCEALLGVLLAPCGLVIEDCWRRERYRFSRAFLGSTEAGVEEEPTESEAVPSMSEDDKSEFDMIEWRSENECVDSVPFEEAKPEETFFPESIASRCALKWFF